MSKKRLDYALLSNDYYQIIELDDEDDSYLRRLNPSKIIEMLNEQENIMGEKRFEVIFYGDVINCVRDENGKEYNLHETIAMLNEQQATIEELRLQEKEKGVPVFVVRDGKNPVALFFNEQRASWFCQENMANLTYQQEKWCRVE